MAKAKSTYLLNLGQFLSVLVMISFTSCDQLYSSREWTDGIMVQEGCVLEVLVADPNKIVEYGVKQLIIDNCASSGSCYREKYEFNSCGKIASIQYFDSNERFLFEEDYQYLDALGNSINFNSQ
jgi:hypothetical protein